MIKSNYHTHTFYSDGKQDFRKAIEKAIDSGFSILGFSDHGVVPFESEWNMKYEKITTYISEIENLKNEFKERIKIFAGVEADYIDGICKTKFFRELGFDYTIGAVHYLPYRFEDGRFFNIDCSEKNLNEGLEKIFEGNIKKLVEKYYESMFKMIKLDSPDIIAHFDIITKFNDNNKFFDTSESWHKELYNQSLKIISNTSCLLEVNARKKYRKYSSEISPSLDILKKAEEFKIPVTINGDVHAIEDFDLFWEDSIEILKDAGYKEIFYFDEKGWQGQKI